MENDIILIKQDSYEHIVKLFNIDKRHIDLIAAMVVPMSIRLLYIYSIKYDNEFKVTVMVHGLPHANNLLLKLIDSYTPIDNMVVDINTYIGMKGNGNVIVRDMILWTINMIYKYNKKVVYKWYT